MAKVTRPAGSTSDYISNKAIWSLLLQTKSLTLASGSFSEGSSVASATVALLNTQDGYCYKYTGAAPFPVVVDVGSLPDSNWTKVV